VLDGSLAIAAEKSLADAGTTALTRIVPDGLAVCANALVGKRSDDKANNEINSCRADID
jgi:uncharacterized protein YbjQ (UPF0145 family)